MIFAGDLGAPEGPVALPDGAWLVVEAAADRGCVTDFQYGQMEVFPVSTDGFRLWDGVMRKRERLSH